MSRYILPVTTAVLLLLFFVGLPDLKEAPVLPFEGMRRRKRIDRLDVLFMAVITLVFGIVDFTHLGSRSAPETFVRPVDESAVITFDEPCIPAEIDFYTGVGYGEFAFELTADGENYFTAATFLLDAGDVLRWQKLSAANTGEVTGGRIAGTGTAYLGEAAFFDGNGNRIAFRSSVPEICDEQDTVCREYSFLNSSYFDEIYHARTAWEHLNNVAPYEISHPPLGKIIIGIGISLFGMNPFGWRFSGTLFGVLMLPAMYVFLKKLFGSRQAAACGTVVFATDFMHFVQTRIATIDTYAVFFILLMYLGMAVFLMTDSLKALALSGICFGLGCACKWTCVYAGAGLAVLWAGYWIGHRKRGFPAFVKNCLFCVGFFVVMPCLIYYLAYIPYGRAAGIKGVFNREYLDIVLSNQTYMFTYHAGLVAEHPYSSRWYQWLLDIRPILYYLQYFDDGSRSSFGAFLNPVLCWGGLLALAVCLYRAIFRLDRTAMFILIGYLAQLLPWVLVTRLTFAYHYFPCCVFLVLAIGYVFRLMEDGTPHCRVYLWGFAGLSAAVFVLFFPALTGLRVDNAAATQLMGWLPTWPF